MHAATAAMVSLSISKATTHTHIEFCAELLKGVKVLNLWSWRGIHRQGKARKHVLKMTHLRVKLASLVVVTNPVGNGI